MPRAVYQNDRIAGPKVRLHSAISLHAYTSHSQATDRTTDETLNTQAELERWIVQHGGRLDDTVHFAHDAQRGVHLQVKPTPSTTAATKGTCVMKIPIRLTMSYFNAIDYQVSPTTPPKEGEGSNIFSSHGVHLPQKLIEAIGPEETTAFFLMGQYLLQQNGFWFPYIKSLPQKEELTTPLFFEEKEGDLEWLAMTSLAVSRERRLNIWKENYERAFKIMQELGVEGVEGYTWYVWTRPSVVRDIVADFGDGQ